MPISIGGVPCEIVPDSLEEYSTEKGAGARCIFTCPWPQRHRVVNALQPQTQWTGIGFLRTPGLAYPPSPNLYAMRCPSIRGLGPIWLDGFLGYREALITCEFETPTYSFEPSPGGDPANGGDPSGQPWTTTTFDVGAEVIKLPGGAYKLSNGEPLEESTTGKIQPTIQINMKRHYVPFIPLAAIVAAAGKLNSQTMRFANHVFPPETLMLAGVPTEVAGDTNGKTVSEMTYKFLGRPEQPWNKFLGRDGNWYYAADASGRRPFQTAALHQLP
jgi:hypothetical protein